MLLLPAITVIVVGMNEMEGQRIYSANTEFEEFVYVLCVKIRSKWLKQLVKCKNNGKTNKETFLSTI